MTADRPRVLFVTSAAFNRITGGGITFSNLFRSWPGDRLATVHNDPVPVEYDVCARYFPLGPDEICRWPASLFARRGGGSGIHDATPKPAPRHLVRRAKSMVAGNAWPDCGRLSARLEAWIEEFQPEILYTILGTIGIMQLVDRIRTRFDLPLVVHFMDDWSSDLYRGGAFSHLARARMERLLRRLVGAATARLAIGDDMAEAYRARYRAAFVSFQNTVDTSTAAEIADAARAARTGSEVVLLYTGSIFGNAQAQSLIDVADAVSALNAAGQPFRLDIHSPEHLAASWRGRLERAPAVRVLPPLEDDEAFFSALGAADLLILPVNFDAGSVRLIRYSMPTKLPAYLAAGTPVLVYGPSEVAQVEDARRHGWGHVVDAPGVDRVVAALRQLMANESERRRLALAARALAGARHDFGDSTRVLPGNPGARGEAARAMPRSDAMSQAAVRGGSLNESVRAFWEREACGTGTDVTGGLEPGTRAWFEAVEANRYAKEPFIHAAAQFTRHRGKRVLEVGVGAGTDHLQWARAGCECHGIDLTETAIEATRRRLALYGLESRLQRVDAEDIPYGDGMFDLVWSWGVIHHSERPERIVAEIHRVLRRGGEFRGMMYKRYSLGVCKEWVKHALLNGRPWRSLADVLWHNFESTGTKAYTQGELQRLFAAFEAVTLETVMTPYDLQHLPSFVHRLMPLSWGMFVVITARK